MPKKATADLTEQISQIAIKIERVSVLIEVLEKGIEEEFEIEKHKLESLCYILSDCIQEVKENLDFIEENICKS